MPPVSPPAPRPPVVLGSGSRYRRELLARLLPAFDVAVPGVDEARQADEPPDALARRLARRKAEAIAADRPGAVVIGSDQVAECAGRILGKPGTAERARAELAACAGRELVLHTAVCVLGPAGAPAGEHLDRTVMVFRPLDAGQIARYVERDQPLDCAGSFKFESLGAALFSEVASRDPTAIQGLPLLWLSAELARRGVGVL